MGFGLSIRLAPGIRVRASSRGLRTSVGPRVARVHVGAGRTTLSSGMGPVTLTPGGSRRRTSGSSGSGSTRVTLAQAQREQRATDVTAATDEILSIEQALTSLHLEQFPVSSRTVVTPTPVASARDVNTTRRRLKHEALLGIGMFDRHARQAAKAEASTQADLVLGRQFLARQIRQQRQQAEADGVFEALRRHDPNTVITAVDAAYGNNAHDSTCIDAGRVAGRAFVTVVIVFGTASMVPDRRPAQTPAGKPTLHKRNKTEINDLYARALASCVVATVNEAFATAIAAVDVNVLVVRPGVSTRLEPVYIGQFPRDDLRTDVPDSGLVSMIERAVGAQLRRKGSAKEVVPLATSADEDLEQLLRELGNAEVSDD